MGRTALRWGLLALGVLLLILGPFALWGDGIEAWVEAGASAGIGARDWGRANPTGPAAVLAGLLAADGLLPVPSSLASTLLGGLLGAANGTLVSAAAMTVGVLLSYLLGRWDGRPAARRLVGEAGLLAAAGWLDRNGVLALALCRPVPVLAEASVIAAGLAGMRPSPVLVATRLANLGISAIYAGLGAAAGGSGAFLLAVAAALAQPSLFMLAARRLRAARS